MIIDVLILGKHFGFVHRHVFAQIMILFGRIYWSQGLNFGDFLTFRTFELETEWNMVRSTLLRLGLLRAGSSGKSRHFASSHQKLKFSIDLDRICRLFHMSYVLMFLSSIKSNH